MLRLETALAKASLTRVERRDPHSTVHLMTRKELQAITPDFRWDAYLGALGQPGLDALNVTEPASSRRSRRSSPRSTSTISRPTLRFHLANRAALSLSKPFVQANYDFFSAYLRGAKAIAPRWKRCVGDVNRDLGEALGEVFVRKVFPPAVKADTEKMVTQIRDAMAKRIESAPWMSAETKQQALVKLRGMRDKIGYPDRWRDYSALEVSRDDFAGNVARAATFQARRDLAKIGKPVDRGEWRMTPPTVNAYYNPQMNDINFPAGVLLPPLYDPKLDAAPNYGNTGGTIGHELTHGFDDEGRQFDAAGNLRNWWTPEDDKEFRQAGRLRGRPVRPVHGGGRPQDQQPAHPRRGRRRPRRADPRLPRLAGGDPRPDARSPGRPDAAAALLRRLRAVGLRRRPSGGAAPLRPHQPALAERGADQRRGGQHAGVRGGLRLQAGPAHDQGAGEGLPDLVTPQVIPNRINPRSSMNRLALLPILALLPLAALAAGAPRAGAAEERPLAALPYTPSLDPVGDGPLGQPLRRPLPVSRAASGSTRTPSPPTSRAGASTPRREDDNLRFLWGMLEDGARSPTRGATPTPRRSATTSPPAWTRPAIEKRGRRAAPAAAGRHRRPPVARPALAALLARLHAVGSRLDVLRLRLRPGPRGRHAGDRASPPPGGLGLPDRDYYLKDDAKSKEIARALRRPRRRRCSSCSGEPPERRRPTRRP